MESEDEVRISNAQFCRGYLPEVNRNAQKGTMEEREPRKELPITEMTLKSQTQQEKYTYWKQTEIRKSGNIKSTLFVLLWIKTAKGDRKTDD